MKTLSFVILAGWVWTLAAADAPAVGSAPASASAPVVARASSPDLAAVQDLILFTQKYTNVAPLTPGRYDSSIAVLTARLLSNYHYTKRALDDEMSGRFLRRYLELLDPAHFHFIQADIKEFEQYRTKLGELTNKSGDTSPGGVIFARYLQRVEERSALAAELLKSNHFDFTTNERYNPYRKDADWPADLAAAKELWRLHLYYEVLQEKLNKKAPAEIVKTLSNRYRRALRTLGEFDSDDVLQVYLSALSQAYDPHSDYMGKAQLENFAISMKLSLFGIGALLQMEDDYCTIKELTPGGPAIKSKKLKPNDKIVAVQQSGQEPVDAVGMKINKVVEMIRGPKGTEVTLTIVPGDAADSSVRKQITLVRDEIKLEDQEAKAKIIDWPDANGKVSRVGVIDLPSFYATFDLAATQGDSTPKSTTEDVKRLLKKMEAEKVAGVVLDLRHNGGGSLEEAIKLTGLFIPEGPIVQVRDANDEVALESDPDPGVVYDGPLVVLTSRMSASASEILAAALQDYGRAVIVGENGTHGKGTVQTVHELNKFMRRSVPPSVNAGALKVTIRKFYRATGSSTQLKGVTPDLVLPSVRNYMEMGESAQENPLEWDTIPSAKFTRMDRVQPCLEALRRRSTARLEKDQDFAYVREDIELYRKTLQDRSLSLNEEQRRKEKAEAEARLKARKQERLARVDPKATLYEINLKQVDQPGLPPPVLRTNEVAKVEEPPDARKAETAEARPGESAEPEIDDKAVPVDATLDEAKRILLDFIELAQPTPKTPSITTVQK